MLLKNKNVTGEKSHLITKSISKLAPETPFACSVARAEQLPRQVYVTPGTGLLP